MSTQEWMGAAPLLHQLIAMTRARMLAHGMQEEVPQLLAFNLGRLAGHSTYIAAHAKPSDVVVVSSKTMADYIKRIGQCNGTQMAPGVKVFARMPAAISWMERNPFGDLWVDDPAWSGTPAELQNLFSTWKRARVPGSFAIAMGSPYK